MRELGNHWDGMPHSLTALVSALSLDKIHGLPFCSQVFMPASTVIFPFAPPDGKLHQLLTMQMEYDYFPVTFDSLRSTIVFDESAGLRYQIDDVLVTSVELPGEKKGFRIQADGSSLVYLPSLDAEQNENIDIVFDELAEFCSQVEVVIGGLELLPSTVVANRPNSPLAGLAAASKLKRLLICQYPPHIADADIATLAQAARGLATVEFACEGHEFCL